MSNISTIIPAISLSASERVCDKIASWKASLLDLTVRNPLVALPSEGIVDLPAPNDVFEPLLRRRKSLLFWDLQNKALDRGVLRETGNYAARTAAWNTFRHLHLQTLSLLQGQDVNALYVVFGILSWVDPTTGETVRSPLLLVPAGLERRPDGTAYSISRSQEEDVEANPVLTHRLAQSDIGVVLPAAPEESYLIPSAYLRKVASLVEDKPGWEVEERTCLGLFPLLKMRLYEDLVAQEARAKGHPLVAALAGDQSALLRLSSVSLPSLAEKGETGSVVEQHLLLDADPAQQRAIFAAAQGQSFVLQGPPGTGKTQTITNIISECIASNKSVLLVSSRMASLDAVLRRLSDKGLGDLCLAAHSLKTSKSDILAQLEQGLTVPPVKIGVKVSKKELESLDGLRADLNAFVRELHQTRLPLDISVYQANGLITEMETALQASGIEPLPMVLDMVTEVSPAQKERMEALVERMATHPILAEAANGGFWTSAFADPDRDDLVVRTRIALKAGLTYLSQIEKFGASLAKNATLEAPHDLQSAERFLNILNTLYPVSHMETGWLLQDVESMRTNRSRIEVLQQRVADFKANQNDLAELYDLSLLDLDHADLQGRLNDRHEAILLPLLGKQWQSEAITRFASLTNVMRELEQGARDLYAAFEALANRCGIPLDESSEGKQRLHRIALRALEVLSPATGWFSPGAIPGLIKQMDEVRAQWFAIGKLRDDLFSVYSEQVLELDHTGILEGLRNQPSGLGRLINTSGMRATNAIKSVTLSGVNTRDRDAARDMESVLQYKEMLRVLQSREALLNAIYGGYYQGAATEWDRLRDALRRADALAAEFAADGGRVPPSLAAVLVLGGEGTEMLKKEQADISALLTGMRQRWEELIQQVLPASLPEPQASLLSIADWCDSLNKAFVDYQDAYSSIDKTRKITEDDAPVTIASLLTALEKASLLKQEQAEVEAFVESFRGVCGEESFQGIDTKWDKVLQGLIAAEQVRVAIGEETVVPQELAERLTSTEGRERLRLSLVGKADLRKEIDQFKGVLQSLHELFTPRYLKETLGEPALERASFTGLMDWLVTRYERVDQINQGARVQSVRDECSASGLGGLFEALCAAVAAGRTDVQVPETLLSLFQVQFYRQWVAEIAEKSSGLSGFLGEEQEKHIARFRDLDRKYLDAAPSRIREMTKARAPKLYPEEVRALKGQLARRRTGEIRKLLAEIPNLLFALKPCVMMNPLSVRMFLDAGAVPFDVVLFDDASQIATEDAIGAILRGSQVIIAGDPKQLPPLSLVKATTATQIDSESNSASDEFESVLDAACSIADSTSTRFGNYSLNWHYRSQNESLIAFSRRYFYPNLVSFPSAQVTGGAISYVSVTDTKDEAGSESTECVLDVVIDYKKRYPTRSIGVITLTETDYARLLDTFARRKEEDPESIAPLLSEEGNDSDEGVEVFFIKMIENVQGDERDLIILHVGADPAQFTPLLQAGSDRLLNVATTRARCDMVVVSALSPLSTAVASAENGESIVPGIQMLNEFLQYAQNPDSLLSAARNQKPSQDAFVRTLRAALVEKGYELRDGIGQSDYRLDLAIVDPASPDRYLLGIECDGTVYAAAETARHRDRLCPEMLTQRGWNLHRVWSLDWNRDANKQLKRIAAAVKAAKAAA
jgi:very-short-patch-repair endonuclease